MGALRIFASPRVWISVVGVAAALAVVFFAYLAAVVSPEENLENLPVALVNEDRGGDLDGQEVNLGNGVVERVTGPDSPAGDTVEWVRPGSREEALEGLGNKAYYGAIVIPADYSERISRIVTPPEIPIAVVNEDRGAEVNGQQANLGAQVADRITSPDSPAPGFVRWKTVGDRGAALRGISAGEVYAAIIVPEDYSARLASLSGPPPVSAAPPATSAAGGAAPEPAEIELLTSSAVRPPTTALIEDAFSGIVGGVSGATGERVLDGLAGAGAPVPPGAGAVISDPVRGEVSEAGVSDKVGPLPKEPKAAEIEVLTNPAAGQAVSDAAQNISTGIVQAVSGATAGRLSETASKGGARLTPEVAAAVGDPVRADVTEAEPVGPDSGNGQSPFFLAFLANLAGLMGAAAVFFAVRGAAEALASRGRRASVAGLWTVRLLVGLLYAALVAAVELWIAFGVLGVEHDEGAGQVWAFLALAVAATLAATMLLVLLLGPAGIGLAAVLTVLLGLVSSGGNAPLEALPGFYRAYADWLPLRYVIDGLRSLLFYDGGLAGAAGLEEGWRDSLWSLGGGRFEAAGLEDAIWVLFFYLAGSAALGYAISLVKDLLAGRSKGGKAGEPVPAEAAR